MVYSGHFPFSLSTLVVLVVSIRQPSSSPFPTRSQVFNLLRTLSPSDSPWYTMGIVSLTSPWRCLVDPPANDDDHPPTTMLNSSLQGSLSPSPPLWNHLRCLLYWRQSSQFRLLASFCSSLSMASFSTIHNLPWTLSPPYCLPDFPVEVSWWSLGQSAAHCQTTFSALR